MTGPAPATGSIPVGPMLSMFDPIHIGGDEFGQPVAIRIIYRNLLAAGEPGGGKSGLLNTLAAHVALSAQQPAWCCSTASKSSSACGTTSPTNSSAPTSTTPSSPCSACRK